MHQDDARYIDIVIEPIRTCGSYKPKFGQGNNGDGLTLEGFQSLYRADPFYHWFGLDNPLMYAAHKAAGGMTSIYRQIGIGCERLFRTIIQESFGLQPEDVTWSYTVPREDGRTRTLSLDGRVPVERIQDTAKRDRFSAWMRESAAKLGVNEKVISTLSGAVFEVRQGYKSKDSKRQNADIANAATAYTNTYLPCVIVLSTQIDADILVRYRNERWSVLVGTVGSNDPLTSTYDFMREIVGYDLAGFFERNSVRLREEVDAVLRDLLAPDGTP